MTYRRLILAGLLSLALAGCVEPSRPEPISLVSLDTAGVKPKVDFTPLARTLKILVESDGTIRAEKWPEVAGTLQEQLKLLALTGPGATGELFESKDQALAWWFNARAAWSIYLAMRSGDSETRKSCDWTATAFPLDGAQMTLADIDTAIEKLGGAAAVMAAPCADLRRAKLPAAPFESKTLRENLATRFEDFVDASDRVVIDVAAKEIRFPPVIWRYRKIIMDDYRDKNGAAGAKLSSALLGRLTGSPRRRFQEAIGYACVLDPRGPTASIRVEEK